MTSIRQMLSEAMQANEGFPWAIGPILADQLADALLASPELAAIIDLAAEHNRRFIVSDLSEDVMFMLGDWRASRAERPTP